MSGNTKQVIQDYDTVFDNSIPFRKNDPLRITYFRIPGVPGLHFVPWHRGSWCLGAAAPVTGAAADEHNLNVVDCNESVTVPRLASIPVPRSSNGETAFSVKFPEGPGEATENHYLSRLPPAAAAGGTPPGQTPTQARASGLEWKPAVGQ